ncbi:1,4-alpha-glucan branching enzyme, partial [Francisella tularensis subsp. holarctica]|nr:1,4-alpha-glucan branching enzyme [Francisella tularensis subsp. holarctica]
WQVEDKNYMEPITDAGLWSVFIQNAKNGDKYKFVVTNKDTSHYVYKSYPYAFFSELRPNTASIITTETQYPWSDDKWV